MNPLNKIYRTIWSVALGVWVAVSEIARCKGKRAGASLMRVLPIGGIDAETDDIHPHRFQLATLTVLCLFSMGAHANPVGANVINGNASFHTSGNTLTITNTPGTILHWQDFSIQQNEVTRFNQQSANSTVLNRVVGGNASQILGSLQSNGHVFLVNPNGVVFGQSATVDVAGLVVTSLKLSDADFLAGQQRFTSDPNARAVSNAGHINAGQGGEIYLIAPNVNNSGVITAPGGEILLVAGNSVELVNSLDPNLRVHITAPAGDATNVGQLLGSAGRLGLFGAVVRNTGQVSADSATMQGGKIVFRASKRTEVSGTVSATGSTGGTVSVLGNEVGVLDGAVIRADGERGGGTVLIGGDNQGMNPAVQNAQVTYVASSASLSADANDAGNGGRVIVWADDTTRAYGSISVKGGINGGSGGFIETSGHYLDIAGIRVETARRGGAGGSWLLDPYDIFIGATDTPATYTGSPNFVGNGGATSYIGASLLASVLDGGTSVIVDTTGTATGTGNITVDAAINTANAGAATLTLKAHNDIVFNAASNMNNNLVLIADQDASGAGDVVFNKSIIAGSSISASGQNIVFASLDSGSTYGLLTATSVVLNANDVITPNVWGAASEVVSQSLTLNAVNGIAIGGTMFRGNVAGTISFSNTNNAVNIHNSSATAGRIFTGTNTYGAVRLESTDTTSATTLGNITSGGNIVLRMNNLTTGAGASINAGTNTVYLNPYTIFPAVLSVSIGGTDTFNLTGADISKITAGKIVIGTDSFGNYAPIVNIGNSSSVAITNAAKLEIWSGGTINVGSFGFSNSGGGVKFVGDSMNIAGSLSAVLVWLTPKTASQLIDLGGTDITGTLGLSATELGLVTTSSLLIGDTANTGNINVSAAIAPSVTTLGLATAGSISQTAAGTISATNLAIDAGMGAGLDVANNTVTNLAAKVANGGNFKFKNSGALNIGTINLNGSALNGISITGFPTGQSSYTQGLIALTSGGALTQSAGAILAGAAVDATGTSVILTKNNATGVIAGRSTGTAAGDRFSYNSSNPILVTALGSAGINSATSIELTSQSGITIDSTGSLVAGGSGDAIVLNAGTGGFANNSSLAAGALSASNGRWLIYAADPASVSKGGLTSAFRHYSGTMANYQPASVIETGNGVIYAAAPGTLIIDTILLTGLASNVEGAAPTAQFGYTIANASTVDNEDLALITGSPLFTPVLSSTTVAGSYTVSYGSGLTSPVGYTFSSGAGLAYTVTAAPPAPAPAPVPPPSTITQSDLVLADQITEVVKAITPFPGAKTEEGEPGQDAGSKDDKKKRSVLASAVQGDGDAGTLPENLPVCR